MKNNTYRGINNGINIITNSSLAATDERSINIILNAEVKNQDSMYINEYCDLSYHTLVLPKNMKIFFHKDVNLEYAEITLPASSIIYCYGNIIGKYSLEGSGSIVNCSAVLHRPMFETADNNFLEFLDEYSSTDEVGISPDINTGDFCF